MKSCPACKVPFDDSFSFCEFDGAKLEKVFLTDDDGASRKGLAIGIRLLAIVFVVLGALLIFGIGSRKKVQVVANQSKAAAAQEPSAFIDTPKVAQEYIETPVAAQEADSQQETARKPGVEVFKPETREAAGSSTSKNQPTQQSPPPETTSAQPNSTPNPTKTRIGERTPITKGSASSATRQEQSPAPPERAATPPVSRPPQSTGGRQAISDEPAAHTGASTVSLNLVRIRSYKTDSGVRYEMTFNMRENGNGRMIRWERLSLVSHSASGITHAEAVPFSQRLGTAGSMTFTVSKEMRGRSESDWQGQISCTGIGTDVDGRAVRSSFTARVNP